MNINETEHVARIVDDQLRELLDLNDANSYQLISSIKEVNTSSFVRRIICKCFPDEPCHDGITHLGQINDVDSEPLSTYIRCIRNAKRDNHIPDEIDIKPGVVYNVGLPVNDDSTNFQNGLIRDLFGIPDERHEQSMKESKFRYKVFALGFILNLKIEDFFKLLLQECGQANINYKDPYEVLFVYCLSKHVNIYENYTNLRMDFERKQNKEIVVNNNTATSYYQISYTQEIEKNPDDEQFVGYILKLPRSTSQTYNIMFEKLYNDIKDFHTKELMYPDKYSQVENLSNTDYDESVSDTEMLKILFGKQHRNGNLDFVKKRISFSKKTLDAIRKGKEQATRDNIIFLLFVEFVKVKEDGYYEILKNYENDDHLIEYMYDMFCQYCNEELDQIDAPGLYLPNPVERVLVYCLVSRNPIETLKELFD